MLTMSNRKTTFLDLPRELRDLIYCFALTHNKPLLYQLPNARVERCKEGFYDSENDNKEFDQLQYVCQQVRKETASLVVRHNDLVFCSQPRELPSRFDKGRDVKDESTFIPGAHLFHDFADSLSSRRRKQLRAIYITAPLPSAPLHKDDYGPVRLPADKKDVKALFALCKSLPSMFVYVDLLNSEPIWMDIALFLDLALGTILERGGSFPKELDSYRESHGPPIGWDPKSSHRYCGKPPTNFRFKPQGKFDEISFLKSIRDDAYDVNVATETLVSLAVKWYSEGF
jgi:hypothetical protein